MTEGRFVDSWLSSVMPVMIHEGDKDIERERGGGEWEREREREREREGEWDR